MKLFKHQIVDIPKLILDDSNYTHIYLTPDGKRLRSVTTMINKTKPKADKKNLSEWRKREGESVADYIMTSAGKIGTEAHKLNENYIRMVSSDKDYSLLSQAHHEKFIPYLDKISTIYGIEAKLFSSVMILAGTADCIADYNGKLSIIDYKTKRSKQRREWIGDYFLQTTTYARMWKELTGQDIEQLVILVSSEQGTFQEFISTPSVHLNALEERLVLFG